MIEKLGYYIYKIPQVKRREFLNACIHYGLSFHNMEETGGQVWVRIPMFRVKAVEAILDRVGISYTRSAPGGLAGVGYRLLCHPGVLVGIVLSVMLYVMLTGVVWEVRIVSRTDIDEDRILAILSECGLAEGSRLSKLDEDEVVADVLMKDPSIAFAAVHLRGVVAEVEIIPYENKEEPQNKGEPCNIVASEDALITDMTVYSGRALVKVGQTVRAGDILVSGVVTDSSGTHLVRASADIRGERVCEISVVSPIFLTETVVTERRLQGLSLCVFGHAVTVGDITDGKETATDKRQLYLFGKVRLPISLSVMYRYETQTAERRLSGEECEGRADEMAEAKIEETVGDGALLTIEKKKNTDEKGCTVSIHMVFENNIGKSLAFGIEKQ